MKEEIKLSNLIKFKYIYLNLKERKKNKVIQEIVRFIKGIRNKSVLVKAILEREKLGSTAIGSGVAIPHAKIKGIKNPLVIFARSSVGVDFNSLDGEPTYIFFLIISPQEEVGIHLKILSKISHLVRDKFIVDLLKKAKDKKEVLKIIAYFEEYTTQNK